jgi:hypothetical protein
MPYERHHEFCNALSIYTTKIANLHHAFAAGKENA